MTTRVPLTFFVLALVFAGPLHADEARKSTALENQVFGRRVGKTKVRACFKRFYHDTHLGLHPRQNVRTMQALVIGDPGEGTEVADTAYQVILDVSFRQAAKHFETVGNCLSLFPAPSRCGIDCDGGSLEVTLKDAKTLQVAIPERARIWPSGTDVADETGPYRKRFGADDKVFRLERTRLVDCVGLVRDPAEKIALRHGR